MGTELIPLTGTLAQISWALLIRAVWLQRVEQSLAFAYPPDRAGQALKVMLHLVNSIPDAAWWIENRHNLKEAFGPVWKAEMEKEGLADA